MRRSAAVLLLPVALLLLPGCDPVTAAGVTTAVTAGSVAVIGRTPPDALVSLVSGRDCSVVRLDRGLSYCAPQEPPPAAPPYCTRSIGKVDCWRQPPFAIPMPQGLAEGPTQLTPAQEANRTQRWPGLF